MNQKRLLSALLTCAVLFATLTYLPATSRADNSDDEIPEAEPWVSPFEDVRPGDWFYGDVEYTFTSGMMTGTSQSPMLYSPNMPLSRGMLVTILYRAAGSPDLSGHINPFDDIDGTEWYADAVTWAATNGIASGYDGGFYADENITRQDFSLVLWRFGAYIGKDVTIRAEISEFTDVDDIAGYAVNAMRFVVAAGVVTGRPGGLLDPAGNATRAEASAMLHRFMTFVG